ncbi:actinia tenebrosa protease inhibitors isoform X4 [Hypanus sabinus]|uniref:actinia tenebrosa protease inhibitors isoform X4 n=1 Tax=Hypanus sabinus TaxID=79690 RepID=UPI0028C3CE62|nr:actinia tenebrosa protease inhibitors isoform X4 [Hypanus sabinus]
MEPSTISLWPYLPPNTIHTFGRHCVLIIVVLSVLCLSLLCLGLSSSAATYYRQVPVLKISHEEDYDGLAGKELKVVIDGNDPDYEHFYTIGSYETPTDDHGVEEFQTSEMMHPCLLPLDEGNCSKYTLLWYYHRESGQCRPFIYSGCKGNANRFQTPEDCEANCKNKADLTKQEGT